MSFLLGVILCSKVLKTGSMNIKPVFNFTIVTDALFHRYNKETWYKPISF